MIKNVWAAHCSSNYLRETQLELLQWELLVSGRKMNMFDVNGKPSREICLRFGISADSFVQDRSK